MKSIKNIEVKDKVILMRADYNVPLKNGQITDDLRIRASVPTIQYLLDHEAKRIVIMSHLGRPEGKDEELSLAPVAKRLAELLGIPVEFVAELTGELSDKVVLLENLRFDPREEENSEEFAKEMIDFVQPDVFVQDGFAVCHRAHASTVAMAKLAPVAVAGLLVEKEVEVLGSALNEPERPFIVVIGGAKVEDKQPLIEQFSPIADEIIVGGKIAADGYKSDDPKVFVANRDFDEDSEGRKLDLGPLATHDVVSRTEHAKTVLWNGVLGYAEDPAYATSSTALGYTLGTNPECKSIICGGDTTAFINTLMHEHPDLEYSLISTGGGAALEFLLGHEMPGLTVL